MRILAITRGAPPIDNVITVGSAIRAYSLLQILKRSGAECFFLSGGAELQNIESDINGIQILPFNTDIEIPRIIGSLKPDFIIVNVSELLQFIPEKSDASVILDLFAHRFVESLFENVDFTTDLFLRIDMLRRADYFIVNSQRQRDFVYSFLVMAGIRDAISRVLVIPQIVLYKPLEKKIPQEPIFIAGGFNWPWSDDTAYINQLADILMRHNTGEIRIYGGDFALKSRIENISKGYKDSPRIKYMGVLPYERLLNSYSEGSVALLCFEKNIERHFSYNFRAVDYLASGLPVIVNDYLTISELVKKYDAGWVVKNEQDFVDTIERILSDNEILLHKSDNVTALVIKEFDVNRNIEPLQAILNSPKKIDTGDGLIQGLIRIVDRYVKEGVEHSEYIRELKKLEAENIRLNERIVAKDSEILRLNNEKTEIMREAGWIKDELKRLGEEVSRIKDENLRLKNERDRFEKDAIELNARITELIRKNGFLEDELVRVKNEKELREDDIIRLKNEVVELKKSIVNLESEIQKRDILIGELRKKEAELEGIKSLPMYKLYKKVF